MRATIVAFVCVLAVGCEEPKPQTPVKVKSRVPVTAIEPEKPNERLTMANYNAVTTGDSLGKAKSLWGEEYTVSMSDEYKGEVRQSLEWTEGRASVSASFKNGVLFSKSQYGCR